MLARIFAAEPLTNIKLRFIDLIDQQEVLNTKHRLVQAGKTKSLLPTFQMFNTSQQKIQWRNIIQKPPSQYENIRDRPRDIINLFFAVNNSTLVKGNKLHNYGAIVKCQYTKVSTKVLYPQSTRRSLNALASLSFDVPSLTLNNLAKNTTTIQNTIEGLENIVLGQPLATGVNDVCIVQKNTYWYLIYIYFIVLPFYTIQL